jgi:hypothetical protein
MKYDSDVAETKVRERQVLKAAAADALRNAGRGRQKE